ncbi:unnamed protein product [Closterium sp. NIES-54]
MLRRRGGGELVVQWGGGFNGGAAEGKGEKGGQWRENLKGREWERYVDGMGWILEHGGGEGRDFRCSHCSEEGSSGSTSSSIGGGGSSSNSSSVESRDIPKGMYVSGVGATDFAVVVASVYCRPGSESESRKNEDCLSLDASNPQQTCVEAAGIEEEDHTSQKEGGRVPLDHLYFLSHSLSLYTNGVLEEEIFMAQPEGFDDGSGRVLRLKKALYGLKQAPRQWYLKLRGVLEESGFTPLTADHSLFMLGEGEQRSFMVVYVDDILIFSPSSDLVKEVMLKVQDKFKCKALGDVSFYLGLHIERDVEKRCMRVHQRKYLEALAANFGQSEGHVATPFPSGFKCVNGPEEESVGEEERRCFHSLVGSLMYAAINTRPDVAFATGQWARVVQCPNEEQVAAGMRVTKYLGQTRTVGLQYSAAAQRRQKGADGVESGRLFLTAFSDASFASEPEDMTSVGGFICCVGGGPTAWESKKQVDQALSSVESEYMALFRAVREIVWQRRLLAELGEEQQGPTPLYCDSKGAIALAKNPVLHGLTKHMRVKWHWPRSMVAVGEVELHYVKTTGQPADMMTKRLVEQQHWKSCKLAGMALN